MTEIDETCFVKGAIVADIPEEIRLKDHQLMGQPSYYERDDDSSLNESDDEQIVANLSDEKFLLQVTELVRPILTGEYTMEAALINI